MSDIEELAKRIAELEEALGSIARRCQESRSQTRRIRWIKQRATAALTGEPFKEHVYQMPKNGERTAEKVWRENVRLKAHIAELEAQQRAGVPEGWKLVPVEITEAMKSAGMDVLMNQTDIYADDYGNVTVETITPRRIYTAMLAAAPAPEAKEQAEHKLSAAGVFKGAEGLRGLLDAQDFWDQQPYGTRLYFGEMANEYLHRDVLRAAVALLDQRQEQAPQPAEVGGGGRDELARALTDLCDEIDKHTVHTPISATNIAWFKRKAREALAAYRKGGGA